MLIQNNVPKEHTMNPTTPELPQRMDEFFNERHDSYDEHMRQSIISFDEFYETIAKTIASTVEALQILDIGCGTGLEIKPIFKRAPNAQITAIDLSEKMLELFQTKHADYLPQITLIRASYLDILLEAMHFDYVVSVMTLHHLHPETKLHLYEKIRNWLKPGGKYIEGDYVVTDDKEKRLLVRYEEQANLVENIEEGAYHIDIPLSMTTQRSLLLKAGFTRVELIWHEGEHIIYTAGD